jgi:hypothetical protein
MAEAHVPAPAKISTNPMKIAASSKKNLLDGVSEVSLGKLGVPLLSSGAVTLMAQIGGEFHSQHSAAVLLQPRFQETAGYRESAHSTRRTVQAVVVVCRQIQQAFLYEWIGLFSKAAAPICLLFYKGTIHCRPQDATDTRTILSHSLHHAQPHLLFYPHDGRGQFLTIT